MGGLDYSAGCVNYRDVGEWLEVLVSHPNHLPTGRILRGGKLDAVSDAADVGSPRTVLNVRRGPDSPRTGWDCDWLHLPLPKMPSMGTYDADHSQIQRWLSAVMRVLSDPKTRYPVLIHCTSGKDRTGMVVAALLAVLGVPTTVIADEFALSDGGVDRHAILAFLAGIGSPSDYFGRLDLDLVRRRVLGVGELAAIDVGYSDTVAKTACVAFDSWQADRPSSELVLDLSVAAPYEPGNFYKRELPCIVEAVERLETRPKVIIIDGYVWLDDLNTPGLGGHVWHALDEATAVIGVAKTAFRPLPPCCEVLRGSSETPLFVTAAGIELDEAADLVRGMHGAYRLPTLLRWVDQLSRGIPPSPGVPG